jgi:hypothetical protein
MEIVLFVAGALFGWITGFYFYKKSSDDLRKSSDELRSEAAELRKLIVIMLNALEDLKIVKLNRDAEGNIIGRHVTRSMVEHIGLVSDSVSTVVKHNSEG